MAARQVLLVESNRALARLIARELGRHHAVTVQLSAEGAQHALDRGLEVDAVVTAYRLRQGSTSRRLLSELRARRPRPRIVLYAEEPLRADARALADVVLHRPAFEDLVRAV